MRVQELLIVVVGLIAKVTARVGSFDIGCLRFICGL